PRPAFLKIQSVHLIALVRGVGVSGYDQRHANNSELHCRTHPRTLAVAPIQEPTKFELSINMKTAKVLGLDAPWQPQQLADAVIE
ncbi:MAG: hypothetical protein QOD29_1863, partial [Alphaproteobacteria bacterium]|nr:hypothetical protein [Alphaproteobacteria bacterium]